MCFKEEWCLVNKSRIKALASPCPAKLDQDIIIFTLNLPQFLLPTVYGMRTMIY